MATLLEELEQIITAFDKGGVEYAVCGGLALAIYGFARTNFRCPNECEKSFG